MGEPVGPSRLSFGLLGPLDVRVDRSPVAITGARRRGLLVRLLLDVNSVVPAERLIEDLWGDSHPKNPSNALQSYISYLRSLLEPQDPAAPRVLVMRRPGYVIAVEPETVDATRFVRLAAEGRKALGERRPGEAAEGLSEALALWRGPALAEFADEPWARSETARLQELRWTVLEDRIEADLALGRHALIASEIDALIAEQPLRERLWGHRMLALYRAGRQAEALRAYAELRRLLGDELGIGPSPALARLEEAILLQRPELAWSSDLNREAVLASGVESRDLEDGSISSSGAGHGDPSLLPVPLDRFVGRTTELEELRRLCRLARLVTLTGVGGVGKTRLALQVAASLIEDQNDGVFWVELASLRNPERVPEHVAAALGVPAEGECSPSEALIRHLRRKQALLVLDNCEHLIDACAELSHALLRAASGLTILATSREPLGVAGENVRLVPVLPEAEAVTLFEQRAAARGLLPSPESSKSVIEICRRLDGIPLAIELAAARTAVISPAEMAQALQDRFAAVGAGPRTAPERHRTLRAAVDWSFAGLSAPERGLFRQLSVFAGGFNRTAVEHVCASEEVARSEVLDLLVALVQKSLVVAVCQPGATTRYRLLEVLRQYAAEKLEEARQTSLLRGRHLQWMLDLAEEAEPHLAAGGAREWLDILQVEQDNFRVALDWARSQSPVSGLRLAAALGFFWEGRDQREGRQWLTDLLCEVQTDVGSLRAKALNALGLLAERLGDFPTARRAYEQASEFHDAAGDRLGNAWSLRGLGNMAMLEGDTKTAQGLYEECLRIGRAEGHALTVLAPLINLGYMASLRGDYRKARALLHEGLDLCREENDEWAAGWALFHLGQVTATLGQYDLSRQHLMKSVSIYTELDNQQRRAAAVTALGYVALLEGDFETADRLHHESLTVQQELGDEAMVAWNRCDVGELRRAQGAFEQANASLNEALDTARSVGDRYLELWSLVRLGRLRRSQMDYDDAGKLLREAQARALGLHNQLALAECVEELGILAASTSDSEKAAFLFDQARALRNELGAPRPPYLNSEYQEALSEWSGPLGEVLS